MRICNTFHGFTGKQLLAEIVKLGEDGYWWTATSIDNVEVSLIPCTLPFANQAEISTVDEATHVAVEGRYVPDVLVRIR